MSCGPQEPPSDHNTSRLSPKLDKGKAKMPKYEDSMDNESSHYLYNEFQGLNIYTTEAKKALVYANKKLRWSTQEKNSVS